MRFEPKSIAVLLAFFLSFKVFNGDNAVQLQKLAILKIIERNKHIFANL